MIAEQSHTVLLQFYYGIAEQSHAGFSFPHHSFSFFNFFGFAFGNVFTRFEILTSKLFDCVVSVSCACKKLSDESTNLFLIAF